MTGHKVVSVLAGVVGAGCLLIAVFADVWGLGGGGVGRRQVFLGVFGAVLLSASVRRVREWVDSFWAGAPSFTSGQCLVVCAWLGLLTAFFEIAQLFAIRFVQGYLRLTVRPADFLWITPMVYLLLFVALGVALVLLSPLLKAFAKVPVVVFAAAFVAVWSQTLFHDWLEGIAGVILALGVALQMARIAAGRTTGFLRLVRRTVPWMVGCVLVLAVGMPVSRVLAERSSLASLPKPPPGAPNVLLIVLDTVRVDHLGTYGYQRDTTPNIDRLAAQSVVFERAMSTSPWTLPSHKSLFTGHYPRDVDWLSPLDEEHLTLAEALGARGYATGGFAGNLRFCCRPFGLGRGFGHYEDFSFSPEVMAFCTALGPYLSNRLEHSDAIRNNAETISNRFLDWLGESRDRPFFAFLNYFDAHHLYVTDPEYQNKFVGQAPGRAYRPPESESYEQTIQPMVDAYDGCLAFLDEHVGRVLDHLEREGLLDNTLVIVTADHGEHFGEHGLLLHGNSLYAPLLHVPLIVSFPRGHQGGTRVDGIASLRDVPATVLDLAGLGTDVFPGRSLRRFWSDEFGPDPYTGSPVMASVNMGMRVPDSYPTAKGNMRAMFAGDLHYIWNGDDSDELYDLAKDPGEEHNLATTPDGRATAARMRAEIVEVLIK